MRQDAVKGFEIMLTFSYESPEHVHVLKWTKASEKWLRATFTPPGIVIYYTDPSKQKEVQEPIDNENA